MARTFDCVFRHLDNLAAFALFAVGPLRQRGVNRGERVEHGVVEPGLIRVHSRGVLTEVVETGKGLSTVAGEWTLAGVFSGG
jgi:hypothetical protein